MASEGVVLQKQMGETYQLVGEVKLTKAMTGLPHGGG